MKAKYLIPQLLALSVLAVPAFAQANSSSNCAKTPDGSFVVTGAQLTDYPSTRSNVTRTGSFGHLKEGYAAACDAGRDPSSSGYRGEQHDNH